MKIAEDSKYACFFMFWLGWANMLTFVGDDCCNSFICIVLTRNSFFCD